MGGSDNVEEKNVEGQPSSRLTANDSDKPITGVDKTVKAEEKNQLKRGKQPYSPPKLTCYGTIKDLTTHTGIRGHGDGGINPRANKTNL